MVETITGTVADMQADVIDRRVEQKGKLGTVRFLGKLVNNPKAGEDLWLGIEWDEAGQGRHSGTVDGHKYFECHFHRNSPAYATGETKCCTFVRYGKISVGGTSLSEAILGKYKPEDMMTEEEKEIARKKEEADLYVNTDTKGMKKIQIVGAEKAYLWRADVRQSRDITLQGMRISEVGPKDTLK